MRQLYDRGCAASGSTDAQFNPAPPLTSTDAKQLHAGHRGGGNG